MLNCGICCKEDFARSLPLYVHILFFQLRGEGIPTGGLCGHGDRGNESGIRPKWLIPKNPLPSFYPGDLLFGAAGGVITHAIVYFKIKKCHEVPAKRAPSKRVQLINVNR